jgi:AMMECR1 domain-containing protein
MNLKTVILMLLLPVALPMPCRAWDEASLLELAREAVLCEVLGKTPPPIKGSDRALPVFVTIEQNGRVIGCRGALQARHTSLQHEVVHAARAAARHDPRYKPLTAASLKNFLVTVTIVEGSTPLTSSDIDALQPEDGLVLQSGQRFGIVLPWEGKAARVRLAWAYRKAGVGQGAACRLFRLKAQRFRG